MLAASIVLEERGSEHDASEPATSHAGTVVKPEHESEPAVVNAVETLEPSWGGMLSRKPSQSLLEAMDGKAQRENYAYQKACEARS